MDTLVQEMGQRSIQINQMQNHFTELAQHATELQMYFGLREIEITTSQTAKYIEDLESGHDFIEKNLEVNISSALRSVLYDVKSFGDICFNSTSSSLQIKAGRKDQAQNLIATVPGIEEIKPSLLTRLKTPTYLKTIRIFACSILPDGKFIILDIFRNQLLLFSNDGIFIRIVITIKACSFDACFVRNNTVTVTFGGSYLPILVDIEKKKNIQTIKLSHHCRGVASDGETLFISSDGRRITRVNLNDMSHTILEGMEGVQRISLFQGNIYGTKCYENKVCCLKSTGEPLWTFQHKDLKNPIGITLNKNGFVYIACEGNNSVVIVSPDGKTCKTILSEADGIKHPWAIDINKDTGIMIVSTRTSNTDTAFVYKI